MTKGSPTDNNVELQLKWTECSSEAISPDRRSTHGQQLVLKTTKAMEGSGQVAYTFPQTSPKYTDDYKKAP
ncbi:hypothetical protein L596_010193 [Steinernema carpocapsae]|uniref:Uncharacterized protein n=1 Tax=Steinernema carpocapsae TaxID=34508 RepID=A0A4U5PHW3_STECR|nr:hypothetical protein L596_010193 [Steinernema carpocapsae]